MVAYLSIQTLMLLAVTELVFTSGLHAIHVSAPCCSQDIVHSVKGLKTSNQLCPSTHCHCRHDSLQELTCRACPVQPCAAADEQWQKGATPLSHLSS